MKPRSEAVNSSPGSALVQIMTCRLTAAKPLPEQVVTVQIATGRMRLFISTPKETRVCDNFVSYFFYSPRKIGIQLVSWSNYITDRVLMLRDLLDNCHLPASVQRQDFCSAMIVIDTISMGSGLSVNMFCIQTMTRISYLCKLVRLWRPTTWEPHWLTWN